MAKKPNPLNAAIVDQVLHHLRNGELRRCLDMGLDPEILTLLQAPGSASVLINSTVIWCNIAVDPEMVKRLLSNKERSAEETRLLQRALRLGATTPMLQNFFGMTPQEVSLQRLIANVPGRPGRYREIPDEAPIWHRFVQLMDENSADHTDPASLLDVAMLLTEEINAPLESEPYDSPERISLGLIWSKIQIWLNEGLYPPGNLRGPAKLVLLPRKADYLITSSSKPDSADLGKVEGERM